MKTVREFENAVKEFYNAPYAVATDCCTHAIELGLRYLKPEKVSCPNHTYLSVPMTFEKLIIDWTWDRKNWEDYYFIGNTNIIDAAVFWKKDGYISGTMMCLSFQFKKHLSLGRGGMILLDDLVAYNELKKMRYDGRDDDMPWAEQNIETLGYHYYMTPETAQLGIDRLDQAINTVPRAWSYKDYPDLSYMKVFNN